MLSVLSSFVVINRMGSLLVMACDCSPCRGPTLNKIFQWSPSRLIQWAETIGPATAAVVNTLLTRRRHPEQGYRSCLGVLRLERLYGPARVEAACRRAQAIDAIAYKSVQSILKTGLDQQPLPEPVPTVPLPIAHDHLRGTTYYQHHEGGV